MNLPERFLLDSNVFISAFDDSEETHEIAQKIIDQIIEGKKVCFIPDFFLNEVLHVLSDKKKVSKKEFESFLYAFYSMPNVLESTMRFFNLSSILDLKKKYKVKMFNDAMLIFLAEMLNIPIITNDHNDFKIFKQKQPDLIYFLDELEL